MTSSVYYQERKANIEENHRNTCITTWIIIVASIFLGLGSGITDLNDTPLSVMCVVLVGGSLIIGTMISIPFFAFYDTLRDMDLLSLKTEETHVRLNELEADLKKRNGGGKKNE